MLTYTLRQIEYFAAAADLGSIAQAAARLHVSQPSVSNAISKLESQLGVQLFIRQHAQGVSLTPTGRRLHREARDLLRHAEDLYDNARSTASAITGELSLGCFVTLGPLFMPALVTLFMRDHPGVTITLREAPQDDLISGLDTGQFDLALLYDLEIPGGIDLTQLASFPPYLLLPQNHRLNDAAHITLADLADEPFVLLDLPPSRKYFLGLFERAGLVPHVVFSSPSLETVRGLVGRGVGYSLLVTRPRGDMTYDGQQIVARELDLQKHDSTVCLARLTQSRPTRLMDAFVNFCQTWFEEHHRSSKT
jgi:DNA-binding transcriptional LysR family regulator